MSLPIMSVSRHAFSERERDNNCGDVENIASVVSVRLRGADLGAASRCCRSAAQ